jgi:hypothetical protein
LHLPVKHKQRFFNVFHGTTALPKWPFEHSS